MTSSLSSDFFARRLTDCLAALERDCLRIVDGPSAQAFGDPHSQLQATVLVRHPRFYRRTLLGGDLGAAESWIDGDWDCDNLTQLMRILLRNREALTRLNSLGSWPARLWATVEHWFRRNSPSGSKRNIHEHYDLGNDFFRLFLDETLTYSCGVFMHPQASLAEASRAKLDRACQKLDLQADDRLVEIGTGWGSLALHAAGAYGCQVTTTTISHEQHRLATERAAANGLANRIQVLNRDYRDLTGRFDKLISIEMIEAVGFEYLAEFFRRTSGLLQPEGRMLLQAIVIKDQFFAAHRHAADFLRRYIFPGGCLPSVTALCQAMTDGSDLRLVHLEEMSGHYAETLRRWQTRFWDQIDAVRQLGYSESFIRKWDYYLRYCEAAFEERQVNVVQMLLAKPACRCDSLNLRLPEVVATASSDLPKLGMEPLRLSRDFFLTRNDSCPL